MPQADTTRVARKDPFDVKLSAEQLKAVTQRLVDEIRTGKQARCLVMDDLGLIDFAYSLYEQRSQQGISRDTPRYGSADLTSPIGTENVDALSSRAAHTIFKQEPLWIVEGLGDSAKKAPVVEEYMQWRQEAMRLQQTCKRGMTAALVETGAVLEVCEDVERTISRQSVIAKVKRNSVDNSIVLDAKGLPLPEMDDEAKPVPATAEDQDTVEVHHVYPEYRRRGAYVRVRSMKDFMMLPNHAFDDREVWGHATRFWLPLADMLRKAEDKEYKAEAVALCGGDTQERQQTSEADRANVAVGYTPGYNMGEKELWRVQCWLDLDGNGLACYIAIVSELHSQILSLKYDWLNSFRTVYLNPYPCPYSVYGYSMILTKLLTTIEEHTAWRNMNADRGTLKSNAPMKRLHGSQWDPSIQPFGAGEVIDVANMNEILPFEFDDVTVQAVQKESQCVIDAQRLIGMNDIAIGQVSEKSRTLGENQMATQQSFVRTDDPIANINEALEEVGRLIHAIEVRTLREIGDGMAAPSTVTQKLQQYGADSTFDGTFTADMIDGQFRFKPRGSSDTADPNLRKKNMADMIGAMEVLAKVSPPIQARMASPQFADAQMQMLVDEYRPRDRAAFLAPLAPPPMPTGAPGMPPGAPPGPQFGGQMVQQMMQHLPADGAVQ